MISFEYLPVTNNAIRFDNPPPSADKIQRYAITICTTNFELIGTQRYILTIRKDNIYFMAVNI